MNLDFTTFPQIETNRLILRQMTEADENEVFFLRSDETILKYIKRPRAHSVEDARKWILKINENIARNESLVWAITQKGSSKLLGTVLLWNFRIDHFRAELGYVLHPDFHRKGIMNETVEAVLNIAFNTLGFHSVDAMVDPENVASIQLLEKNKFVREGYFKEDFFFQGEFFDTGVYSLLASKWRREK